MNIKLKILSALVMLVVLVLLFINIRNSQKKSAVEYHVFDSSNVVGILDKIRMESAGEVSIEIQGNKYLFVAYNSDGKIFEYVAEKGDSIFKPSYADSITLYHGNQLLKYGFLKPKRKDQNP